MPILPVLSIRCLFTCLGGFALCIIAGGLILEKGVLPYLASRRLVETDAWRRENAAYNANNDKKIRPTPERVWQSAGHAVSPRKSRSKRILVLGDSFVWGDGYLNMNDLWWRRLQRELRRRGYLDVEVIAAGFRAYGSGQQLELLREIAPVFSPDAVVWGYVTNDPDEGVVVQRGHLYEPRIAHWSERDPLTRWLTTFRKRRLVPVLTEGLLARRLDKLADTSPSGSLIVQDYGDWEMRLLSGENFQRYRATVARIADYQASASVPCFFLTLPNRPDPEYFRPRLEPVAEVFKENGIPWHDTLDEFVRRYAGSRSPLEWGINPANGHPGLRSTSFFAEQAADILERDFPSALPSKHGGTVQPPDLVVNDWFPCEMSPKQDGTSVSLTFPLDRDRLLRMPYGEPHVFLAFEEAVALRSVRLHGAGLLAARIAIVYDDPENMREDRLDHAAGPDAAWSLPETSFAVNALRISCEFSSADRDIRIELERR